MIKTCFFIFFFNSTFIASINPWYYQIDVWNMKDKKAEMFLESNEPLKDFKLINQDFLRFYDLFLNSKDFQLDHISNTLIGIIGECESTAILTKENWKTVSFDIRDTFNDTNFTHTLISTESQFFLRSRLNEIGVISELGFEKKGSKWFLTLYFVNAC